MINKIICYILGHAWTSKAEQGLYPTKEELDQGIGGFYHYSVMYCDRCGRISELNKKLRTHIDR